VRHDNGMMGLEPGMIIVHSGVSPPRQNAEGLGWKLWGKTSFIPSKYLSIGLLYP
jgi:hypothetical protein